MKTKINKKPWMPLISNSWQLMFVLYFILRGSYGWDQGLWLLQLDDYRSDEQVPMEKIMTARDGLVSLIGTLLFSLFYLINAIPVFVNLTTSKKNENDRNKHQNALWSAQENRSR